MTKCAHCEENKDLRRSHIINKSFFNLLKCIVEKQHINQSFIDSKIKQIHESENEVCLPLLCRDCEDLFNEIADKYTGDIFGHSKNHFRDFGIDQPIINSTQKGKLISKKIKCSANEYEAISVAFSLRSLYYKNKLQNINGVRKVISDWRRCLKGNKCPVRFPIYMFIIDENTCAMFQKVGNPKAEYSLCYGVDILTINDCKFILTWIGCFVFLGSLNFSLVNLEDYKLPNLSKLGVPIEVIEAILRRLNEYEKINMGDSI
jgi:hypothetical protein